MSYKTTHRSTQSHHSTPRTAMLEDFPAWVAEDKTLFFSWKRGCHTHSSPDLFASLCRLVYSRRPHRALFGPNVKNPPKIRLENLWNWRITLVPATVWQIFEYVEKVQAKAGNGSYKKNMLRLVCKNSWNQCEHSFRWVFSHLKSLCRAEEASLNEVGCFARRKGSFRPTKWERLR